MLYVFKIVMTFNMLSICLDIVIVNTKTQSLWRDKPREQYALYK